MPYNAGCHPNYCSPQTDAIVSCIHSENASLIS